MDYIAHYLRVIEEAISKMGIDPAAVRTPRPAVWQIEKGSARVRIEIFQLAENGPFGFNVMSPIFNVSESAPSHVYGELLQINHKILGAGFSLFDDIIYLRSTRMLEGMDANEAVQIIGMVAGAADHYDDLLKERFPEMNRIGYK